MILAPPRYFFKMAGTQALGKGFIARITSTFKNRHFKTLSTVETRIPVWNGISGYQLLIYFTFPVSLPFSPYPPGSR